MAEGLGLDQALRLREAEKEVQDDEGEQPDKEQDVANSSGREPIDQEMGDQHPERGRDDQKEGKDEERPEIEQPAAAEDCSVGSEDREAEEQHHPGGVDRRRDEPRVKKG